MKGNVRSATTKMTIYISYIETKKFYATDLLSEDDNLLDAFSIKNVSSVKVDNELDALKTLFKGMFK